MFGICVFVPATSKAEEREVSLDKVMSLLEQYYDMQFFEKEFWLLTDRTEQWEIFVDEQPNAEWEHDCKIFKYPKMWDFTTDIVPQIIKPTPQCPPNEGMEPIALITCVDNVRYGELESQTCHIWETMHTLTIRESQLNQADFLTMNDCVNYRRLGQICMYDVQLENNAIPACAFVCYWVNGGGFNNLQHIILPEGVETIGLAAFRGCDIRFMTFPSSVKTLEIDSCSDWKYIKWIYSEAVTPPTCDEYAFGGLTPEDTPIYVPVGSAEAYRNALGWDYFTTFIETDEAPSAGIEAVTPSSEVKAYWADGAITIMSADDTFEYSIYSIDGRLVSQGIATGKEVRIPAPKSVYVVKSGRNVFKIF